MRYSFLLAALLPATKVVAFPSRMFDLSVSDEEKRALAGLSAAIETGAKEDRAVARAPGFSASQQYVSNTGAHAFVPPGKTDLRGPCPGLNAMANHNYIPHSGVATISQFIQGTYDGEFRTSVLSIPIHGFEDRFCGHVVFDVGTLKVPLQLSGLELTGCSLRHGT